MGESAIHVEQLSKIYRIGGKQERYRTLRDTIGDAAAAPLRRVRASLRRASRLSPHDDNTIRALDNVSFEVRRGEVVGIIGRNGAGKSTLLKILSRITEPSAGFAEIRGRVGSLLEVGTGFHPELTGRENIFLNGAILGMKRGEIERKFDEIVDFAEVARFVDTPVKHFSSGMYLRLAFAVAAHMETEILLVDEVLAVGDVAFQRKCLGKMQEVGDTGRTVLFVSHDMTAIARLAGRTVLLDGGRVGFLGATDDAIGRYVGQGEPLTADLRARSDRQGDGVIRMDSIQFFNAEGQAVDGVGSGDALTIAIGYSSGLRRLHPDDIMLDMRFRDSLSHPIATFSTRFSALETRGAMEPSGVLLCQIPSLPLAEETYGVDLWLAYRGYRTDAISRAKDLRVTAANYFGTGYLPVKRKHGAALIRHSWEVAALDHGLPALDS